jgi:hypothetical protein
LFLCLFGGEGKQGDLAGAFDGVGELALVLGAGAVVRRGKILPRSVVKRFSSATFL